MLNRVEMLSDYYRQRVFTVLVLFLSALFIVSMPGFTKLGSNTFYLMSIVSFYYVFVNFSALPKLSKHEKIFFSLIILGFFWKLITFYINGAPEKGNNILWSRQVFLLMIIPLYFLFMSINVSSSVILGLFCFASVVIFVIAVDDVYVNNLGGYFPDRARGGMHPILFGSIALSMAGCLLSFLIYEPRSYLIYLAGYFSIALLCVAVFLSESRGVWIVFPLLFIQGFIQGFPKMKLRNKLFLLAAAMILTSGLYFVPMVKDRVDRTIINVQEYAESDSVNDKARESSLGTRLEMWKSGIKMFYDSPIFGVGVGGYQETARLNLEKYNVNKAAAFFYHPHNQYISALATQGVLGLFFLLSILFYPMFLVWKSRGIKAMPFVFSGWFISLSYSIYSLTDVPLEGKATIIFFSTAMAFILASVKKFETLTTPLKYSLSNNLDLKVMK